MKTVWISGREIADKAELHRAFSRQLEFPDYYGANLDALYDCLTDLTGEIRLYHTAALRRSLNAYGEKILRVLKDAQSDALKVEFVD